MMMMTTMMTVKKKVMNYTIVVSIFFSIIPVYPQYIPHYTILVSIFCSIMVMVMKKSWRPRATALGSSARLASESIGAVL